MQGSTGNDRGPHRVGVEERQPRNGVGSFRGTLRGVRLAVALRNHGGEGGAKGTPTPRAARRRRRNELFGPPTLAAQLVLVPTRETATRTRPPLPRHLSVCARAKTNAMRKAKRWALRMHKCIPTSLSLWTMAPQRYGIHHASVCKNRAEICTAGYRRHKRTRTAPRIPCPPRATALGEAPETGGSHSETAVARIGESLGPCAHRRTG